MIESCRLGSDVRLRSSPYSSRTREMQRSMIAALLTRTSSTVDRPLTFDPLENLAALFVQPRILRKHEIFELSLTPAVGHPDGSPQRNNLHPEYRRCCGEIDKVDVSMQACGQPLLNLEA